MIVSISLNSMLKLIQIYIVIIASRQDLLSISKNFDRLHIIKLYSTIKQQTPGHYSHSASHILTIPSPIQFFELSLKVTQLATSLRPIIITNYHCIVKINIPLKFSHDLPCAA